MIGKRMANIVKRFARYRDHNARLPKRSALSGTKG
jgi:hypothetical protein